MVQKLSGAIAVKSDTCARSCAAFTGAFAELESRPLCEAPRYDPDKLEKSGGDLKVPQKEFTTFLAGLQIQGCWKHPDTAKKALYRQTRTSGAETGKSPTPVRVVSDRGKSILPNRATGAKLGDDDLERGDIGGMRNVVR